METAKARPISLGVGSYQARRFGDKVVLSAGGETPTPNYKVWLHAGAPAQPPVYELRWREPADTSIRLPTPFHVHVSLRADADALRVRDATGVHEVAIEAAPSPATEPSTALVYLHHANQYDLDYRGRHISFIQANIAGDPLLTYEDRYFYGGQISAQQTEIGELVTVTLEDLPEGGGWRLSMLLPPTWVSGYEAAPIEALVFETMTRKTIAGSPAGQEVEYEHVATVKGRATFVVS
jgi:hypothetical protein